MLLHARDKLNKTHTPKTVKRNTQSYIGVAVLSIHERSFFCSDCENKKVREKEKKGRNCARALPINGFSFSFLFSGKRFLFATDHHN